MMNQALRKALQNYELPASTSHKGQNGKLLIIGGSELFHAASKWSLDVASHIVDMVFYSSVPSNNELVQQAKSEFWSGIVVPRLELESYIDEADCVLIGPGMERRHGGAPSTRDWQTPLTKDEWDQDTERVTNYLLAKYPSKKWVIDAGALQMVDPALLNERCILTPHYRELQMLVQNYAHSDAASTLEETLKSFTPELSEVDDPQQEKNTHALRAISTAANNATILLKGVLDYVATGDSVEIIAGGNPGMTKGGTGDVLAGLVAALYCTVDAKTAVLIGSYINKRAGKKLADTVGPFFSTSDLAAQVPKTLWEELASNR